MAAYIAAHLSAFLGQSSSAIELAFGQSHKNIQTILKRQLVKGLEEENKPSHHPICRIQGEEALLEALHPLDLADALFTLARIYDAGHIALCNTHTSAQQGKPHNVDFIRSPCIDVTRLTEGILYDPQKRHDDIKLVSPDENTNVYYATWSAVSSMSFDQLPTLSSLSGLLPGEISPGRKYAGIGGGGGSDIISASLLGHLLRREGKEMDTLVSTRTWRTGSQGKQGSNLGIKREVLHHGGPAVVQGTPVAGTYRIVPQTWTEGRDLETVPIHHHKEVFLVLDQGEEAHSISKEERADLAHQFHAVLAQCSELDTIVVVDTGGDVFGGSFPGFSTPDQDVRVQRAIATLHNIYPSLVTAVLAPGVDAPADAPEKAMLAGGKVYKLTADERALWLDILRGEYQMDGSNPDRFGKTNLCLQAALRGEHGWICLDLPAHVVDTWQNPWSCFAYIRECMSDVILMPLMGLLPLIDPRHM